MSHWRCREGARLNLHLPLSTSYISQENVLFHIYQNSSSSRYNSKSAESILCKWPTGALITTSIHGHKAYQVKSTRNLHLGGFFKSGLLKSNIIYPYVKKLILFFWKTKPNPHPYPPRTTLFWTDHLSHLCITSMQMDKVLCISNASCNCIALLHYMHIYT